VASSISDEVKQFITDHINSLEQLEVLLLLQSNQTKEWSADQVARELRIDPNSTATRLADLYERRLLNVKQTENPPLYWYEPSTRTLERIVSELGRLYPDHRVSIINLIFSKPIDKIKTFADAFKLREDK
jgi:hypothetical protein